MSGCISRINIARLRLAQLSTSRMIFQSHTPITYSATNRYYYNFGHKRKLTPKIEIAWCTFLFFIPVFTLFDWNPVTRKLKKWLSVEAKSIEPEPERDETTSNQEEEGECLPIKSRKKSGKPGFRERKIIEYENRIRAYSTPDKIFRYFATAKVHYPNGDCEIFMTPHDFLRSITPGILQPEGLGLDRYRRIDVTEEGVQLKQCQDLQDTEFEYLNEDSIFYKLSDSGMINFSDYIFLLTILSASKRHFEIAFRMFDLNGDGNVDYEEFEKVQAVIRNQTSVGCRHRDHQTTGNIYKGVSSALGTYFFGNDHQDKLTIDRFLTFQRQLQEEILTLEFSRQNPVDGLIKEHEFACLLLTYAGLHPKKRARMLKRVKRKFKGELATGIGLDDYLKFFHFLNNITEVDTALTFYHIAGASIDVATLKHVAQTVAHVELRDHVCDVVFTLFDENQDGQLSNKEFVAVMKERLHRGLEKPKDTGFIKLFTSVIKCAKTKAAAAFEHKEKA